MHGSNYYSKNYVELRKLVLEEKLIELNKVSKELINCNDPVKYKELSKRLNLIRMTIDNLRDDLGYIDYMQVVKTAMKMTAGTIGTVLTLRLANMLANKIFGKKGKR